MRERKPRLAKDCKVEREGCVQLYREQLMRERKGRKNVPEFQQPSVIIIT